MQRFPAPAEPAHHAVRRRDRQRGQQQQRQEADRDERPARDVGHDAGPVQILIQDQPRQEVQQHVAVRKHAEHAPQLDQPRRVEPVAQWRDRERDEQHAQAPLPERVLDLLDRVCAEVRAADLEGAPHQRGERQQAQHEQRRLEHAADDGRGRHQ
jgi:hypothetical protein